MALSPPITWRRIQTYGTAFLLALLAWPCPARAQGQRHALLVGVGDYNNGVPPLEGPPHDIEALRKALADLWGFPPGNIRVLLDGQATKAGILAAVEALEKTTRPADFVFLYFSGHGTSGYERSDLGIDGNSGAIVPADFDLEAPDVREGLIVGSRDLRPRLERLDKDRHVFAVFDSCYSGAAVRSLRAVGKARYVPLPTRSVGGAGAPSGEEAFGSATANAPPYPYRNVLYFSAASKSEAARDVTTADLRAGRARTVDGRPHGALTNALLEGLGGAADTNHDGALTYGELYDFVRDRVSQSFPQQPQALLPEGNQDVFRSTPVLASKAAPAPPPAPASPGRSALRVKVENLPAPLERRIRTTPGMTVTDAAYDVLVAREKDGFRLYHGSGDVLASYASGESDAVAERVAAEVAVRELVDLSFPEQDFNVSLSIPGNRGFLTKGESFSIAFSAEKEAHVLLLDVDVGGHVSVLYPYEPEEAKPTRSGAIGAPADLKVSPPFGTEYLKVFAFHEKPAGFERWMKKSFSPLGPELGELLRMIKTAKGSKAQGRLKVVTRETAS